MSDPIWLVKARAYRGLREIPGKKHNPTIQRWLRSMGAWWTDDETPWCGTFVAHCLRDANFSLPVHWYRARGWEAYGLNLRPDRLAPGAILVFARAGGGHVGFYEAEDDTHFHVFGGNQSNMVNTTRIAKERLLVARWPSGVPVTGKRVFVTPAGTPLSTNEA